MSYVSFNDVIELNGILKDKGLNFRIHLRDTCGRQSFWIEPLGNCACEGRYDEMYQVVEEYLEGKRIFRAVRRSEDEFCGINLYLDV